MWKKNLLDFVNRAMVSDDSVTSHWGLLEVQLGVKDILHIF